MLSILKLNRRKGIRELSKFLMNEIADKNTKILFKQLLGSPQPRRNFKKSCETTPKAKSSARCSNNYIIDFIK